MLSRVYWLLQVIHLWMHRIENRSVVFVVLQSIGRHVGCDVSKRCAVMLPPERGPPTFQRTTVHQ